MENELNWGEPRPEYTAEEVCLTPEQQAVVAFDAVEDPLEVEALVCIFDFEGANELALGGDAAEVLTGLSIVTSGRAPIMKVAEPEGVYCLCFPVPEADRANALRYLITNVVTTLHSVVGLYTMATSTDAIPYDFTNTPAAEA